MPHARIPLVPLADRRAFSPAEVAAVTGFSLSFIYEQIKSGALRSRKIAGRRIVTAEALADLLGEATGTAAGAAPEIIARAIVSNVTSSTGIRLSASMPSGIRSRVPVSSATAGMTLISTRSARLSSRLQLK